MSQRGKLRYVLLLAAVLALGVTLTACGGDDDDDVTADEPITIGFAIGQSGILEAYDTPAQTAADLAIEDINAEGGVDGRELRAIDADTASEAAQAATAAIRLLDQGADVLIVGCDFDLGGGASAIEADNRGVLALSTCGASTKFGPEAAGDLVFTMATAAPANGATMAEFAEEQGYERPFVIEEVTVDFHTQVVHGFEERWQQLGGELAGKETMENDDESFAAQISSIEGSDADVVFLASYMPGAATFLRQAQAAGIDLPILATEDFDGDAWKDAVQRADDIWYATYASLYGDDPEPRMNDMMDRFEQETGNRPELSLGVVTGYSAIEAIARAIEEADGSTEGEELAQVMRGWEDEEFLVGPTTFTEDLHITRSRDARMMVVQDGETSFLELWRPEEVSLPEEQD